MDLQRASVTKRTAAWLLDTILVCILAVGFAVILSAVLRYDDKNADMKAAYESYEQEYGAVVGVSEEVYNTMPAQQQESYNEVAYLSNLVLSLTLVMVTVSLLLSMMVTEFVIPLILKNGQTVGKKVFGIGLVRIDGVRANKMQIFVRALLGKYTVETMIPLFVLIMILFGILGMVGTIVLMVLGGVQLICVCVTRNRAPIHDLMAGTVAVDLSSQEIFSSTEELIAYTKRIHAERAKKQDY